MPALGPILIDTKIVDEEGRITDFFRQRWQELLDGATTTPAKATISAANQGAAIATTRITTALQAGNYRVSYYIRKTTADGVSSSVQFSWAWTESGVPLSKTDTALTTDTTAAVASGSFVVKADAASDLNFSVAYASNTPGAMRYRIEVVAELIA